MFYFIMNRKIKDSLRFVTKGYFFLFIIKNFGFKKNGTIWVTPFTFPTFLAHKPFINSSNHNTYNIDFCAAL